MTTPSRQTTAGRVYLDRRGLAQTTGRTTDELLQLYALEGFLDRLTQSDQRDHFVLKGGVLLAAYDARRATRDVDFAARQITNDFDTMLEAVRTIFAVHIDDGLTYSSESLRAQIIREDDDYSGLRITATAALATARLCQRPTCCPRRVRLGSAQSRMRPSSSPSFPGGGTFRILTLTTHVGARRGQG